MLPYEQILFLSITHSANHFLYIFMCSSIWIRSDTPYRIEISLRMLKDTLFVTSTSLHPDCFNLAVRKLASAEVERHAGTNMVGGKHYFDLQFHAQSRALRYSWMPQGQRTSTLINNAVLQPFPRYDVFNSTIVRVFNS